MLLIADVRLNREGLAGLLERDGRLRVTALAPSVEDVQERPAPVDVIVVDTAAHDAPALASRLIGAEVPAVALGAPEDERSVIAFAELGVVGFVPCDASLDALVASILGAARGEASFPPSVATTLLRRVTSLASRRSALEATALTVREHQVVQLIAEGLSNKEIATRLCIEVATVKNHVHNILEKLQVSSRSDAVAHLRLIESGDPVATLHPISAARSTTRSTTG